jgi:hypothetical protein
VDAILNQMKYLNAWRSVDFYIWHSIRSNLFGWIFESCLSDSDIGLKYDFSSVFI